MRAAKVPIDRWMDKGNVVYKMEYLSQKKKNENLPFATMYVDLKGILLSEMLDKERQTPYVITYMWNIETIQMNIYNKTKTDSQT